MKIYQVNDCDYVAAESPEEARTWYLETTGVDETEEVYAEPIELAEEDLDTLKFFDAEGHFDNETGIGRGPGEERVYTLREALQRELEQRDSAGEPFLFASTEY